jgi:MFS family permease
MAEATVPTTTTSLRRNRNFLLLWIAQFISAAGDTFTFLAAAIKIDSLFTEAGDSTRALAGVMISFVMPQLLLALFAGTLADRINRRVVMIASDVGRALLIPGLLLLRDAKDLPLAFAIAFLVSSFSVFFNPARTALLPMLVADHNLLPANSWMQVGRTISTLVGPILAGIVVAHWGTDVAFLIDASSFLISAMLLAGIRVMAVARPAEEERPSAWSDLTEGIRFATGSRLVKGIALGVGLAMLGVGAVDVLFVPFTRRILGAGTEALGLIMTVQGTGMMAGGLLLGTLSKRLPARAVALASMTLLGIALGAFGFAPTLAVAVAIILFLGFAIPPVSASLRTMLQEGVGNEILGRAGAVMETASSVATLVSMGAAGWVANAVGIRETYMLGGALVLLGTAAMGFLVSGEKKRPSQTAALSSRGE